MHYSLRTLLSLLAILVLLAACGPIAPETTDTPAEEERLRVVVSILPVANIVYNIGGGRIDLDAIMPPGADPHTFEPRPSDAVRLSQADLIFFNGMHLDESTLKLAEANLKEGAEIIELAAAVAGPDELIYGQEHHHGHAEDEDDHEEDDDEHGHAEEDDHDDDDEHGHAEEEGHDDDDDEHGHAEEDDHDDDDEHGHAEEDDHDDDDEHGHAGEEAHDDDDDEHGHAEEDDHDDDDDEHGHAEEDDHEEDDDGHDLAEEEGEPDPHLFLDPNFVIRYAKVVFVSLAERDPENRDYYESNFNEYTARLLALDEAIVATTATIPESNRRLLTYHDSFGYFAIRYGYTVIGAIQPNDISQPSAQEVAALIDQLLDEGVPAIFGSILFPADVIDLIASETGVTVSTLLDDGLPGEPDDPEHTYIGMMVENLKTLASVLGGDPSLMDGVEVGNVPDSE